MAIPARQIGLRAYALAVSGRRSGVAVEHAGNNRNSRVLCWQLERTFSRACQPGGEVSEPSFCCGSGMTSRRPCGQLRPSAGFLVMGSSSSSPPHICARK